MVGLIYLGSVLAHTFLIGLGQRDHHSDLDYQQVFRFPRVLITTLRVCIAVPGVLGIAVYQSFPRPGVLELTFCCVFFGALTLIVIASYYQTSRFSVAVGPSRLTLHSGSRSREISLSGVRRLVVRRPWRGRGYLELRGTDDGKLCRLDGGIQDFDELVDAVESGCAKGTPVRDQDTEGRWSDRFT